MKMEDMYLAMDLSDALINLVNSHLKINKFIAWNEMHQKPAGDLIKLAKENMGDEDAITIADWTFDINTFNALTSLLKYAEENGEGIIISYELSLAVICKSKDIVKDILKKLPQQVIETSQFNMANVDVFDDSILVTYNNTSKQIMFTDRPKYIYDLLWNSYE